METVFNEAYPGIVFPAFGGKITHLSVEATTTRIFHTEAFTPQEEAVLQQTITDYPAYIAAHNLHRTQIQTLLSTLGGNGEEAEYFITLQAGLETVLTNGTALATFYHQMLTNLKSKPAYYAGYINLLEEATAVTQAQIDVVAPALPTVAQMRTAYQMAIIWKDAGMWRVLISAIRNGLLSGIG
jgi:hypothetical protein